jgi:transcriptional regulator with XRE-family HTH domain
MDVQKMLQELLNNGYTEAAIAKGADVSQSTISRILRGVTQPKAAVFFKISSMAMSEKSRVLYIV